jgi:hypothetical protein
MQMANAAAVKTHIINARFRGDFLTFYFVPAEITYSAHVSKDRLYLTGNGVAGIVNNVLLVTGDCTAEIKENVIIAN